MGQVYPASGREFSSQLSQARTNINVSCQSSLRYNNLDGELCAMKDS